MAKPSTDHRVSYRPSTMWPNDVCQILANLGNARTKRPHAKSSFEVCVCKPVAAAERERHERLFAAVTRLVRSPLLDGRGQHQVPSMWAAVLKGNRHRSGLVTILPNI